MYTKKLAFRAEDIKTFALVDKYSRYSDKLFESLSPARVLIGTEQRRSFLEVQVKGIGGNWNLPRIDR